MKVKAEVKITILDGEKRGAVHTFTSMGETQPQYMEDGVVERLRLEWNYFTPYKMSKIPTGEEVEE